MTNRSEEPELVDATPEVRAFLEQMGPGALSERVGIVVIAAAGDRVVARMPVAGNTQAFGMLHGGASAVLAEQIGSVAAQILAAPDRVAVGIELSISHHRSVQEGFVTGTATALASGKTLVTYAISIVDDQNRRVATGRLSCLFRDIQ